MDTTTHIELSRAHLKELLAHLKNDDVHKENLKTLYAQLHTGSPAVPFELKMIDRIGVLHQNVPNRPISDERRLVLIGKIELLVMNTPEESKYVLSMDGLIGKSGTKKQPVI